MKKIIAVDLDGTLSTQGSFPNIMDLTPNQLNKIYRDMKPNKKMIKFINDLATKGHLIYIYTSRWDLYQDVTAKWLKKHGVKYEFFQMNKNYFDFIIDDKAINVADIQKDPKKFMGKINGQSQK